MSLCGQKISGSSACSPPRSQRLAAFYTWCTIATKPLMVLLAEIVQLQPHRTCGEFGFNLRTAPINQRVHAIQNRTKGRNHDQAIIRRFKMIYWGRVGKQVNDDPAYQERDDARWHQER